MRRSSDSFDQDSFSNVSYKNSKQLWNTYKYKIESKLFRYTLFY